MRKGKIFAAVLLSAAMMTATACNRQEAVTSENVDPKDDAVEVDYSIQNNSIDGQEEISTPDVSVNGFSDYYQGSVEDLSWFDDCVFLGDSLIGGLGIYNDAVGKLGNAQFVYSSGLGYANSQWDIDDENEVHPYCYGQKILLEDAVSLVGARKVIIGMGMNDLVVYDPETTLEYAESLIEKIEAKNPGVIIYLETITPMIESAECDRLNKPLIREYDAALESFCEEKGYGFLNTWSAVADENGVLPYELCEDPDTQGIHLTVDGYSMVADYILHNIE